MTDPAQSPPGAGATTEELEADLAATRARLADRVDALASKVDVKTQAQQKVDDVRAQASARVSEVRATAQEQVVERVKELPRPVQLVLAAAPVLLVGVWLVQKVRRS